MIESLETLLMLQECGTTFQAATRLRITQSTVSKRIAVLSDELGMRLVEPAGRRVRLTPEAIQLLEKAAPLLGQLRQVLSQPRQEQLPRKVKIGVSESILASWGPLALKAVTARIPGVEWEIHAHRSPLVLDRIRNHELMLGLCAGVGETVPDLHAEKIGEEPLVLISGRGHALPALRRGSQVDIMTIEEASATWKSVHLRLNRLQKLAGITFRVTRRLESFSSVVQMARAGFGHGLAPMAVVRAMGAGRECMEMPGGGLSRPISLVGKPGLLAQSWVKELARVIRESTPFDNEGT